MNVSKVFYISEMSSDSEISLFWNNQFKKYQNKQNTKKIGVCVLIIPTW